MGSKSRGKKAEKQIPISLKYHRLSSYHFAHSTLREWISPVASHVFQVQALHSYLYGSVTGNKAASFRLVLA